VLVAVVLKYSLNLVADPEVAAEAAALASAAQSVSAFLVEVDWALEHPD
tara:strand:- start:55 stop:201 length:147 start_codon:yes stop_codon:yes gene_type:complete